MLQDVNWDCGTIALPGSRGVHVLAADAAQCMHECASGRCTTVGLENHSCLQHLKGLDGGRTLDLAQVPEELQGNLFTAAVAAGLQVAPNIKPGSDRMKHR